MLSACLIICCLLVSLVCVGAHDSWNCAAVCRCSLIQLGLFPRPPLPHSQIWVLLHYSPTMVLLYAHHLCTSLVHWKLSPMPESRGLKVVLLLLESVETSNFRSTNFEPSQLWPATGFSVQILEVFIIAWLRLPMSFSLNGMLHYPSPFHFRRASMSVWRISYHSTTLQSMLAVTWLETRPSLLQPEMDTGRWARDQLLIQLLVPIPDGLSGIGTSQRKPHTQVAVLIGVEIISQPSILL